MDIGKNGGSFKDKCELIRLKKNIIILFLYQFVLLLRCSHKSITIQKVQTRFSKNPGFLVI